MPFFRRPVTHLPTNLNRLRTKSNVNREKQYNFFLADFSKLSYNHYMIDTFCQAKGGEFCNVVSIEEIIKYTYTINIFKAVVVVSEKSTKSITFVFFAMIKSGVIYFFYILSTHEHGRFILSVNLEGIFQSCF